jgi:hypothetical protein
VCELRRGHPRWGALRLVHELQTAPGLRERLAELAEPAPSRTTVHRILVRHGLLAGRAKRRPREYRRWERDTAMARNWTSSPASSWPHRGAVNRWRPRS